MVRRLMLALAALALAATPCLGAPAQWIVAPAHNPQARALARASGAHEVDAVLGIWTAPAPLAHRLAGRLRARGLLRYEEPDRRALPERIVSHDAAPDEVAAGAWWRGRIIGSAGEVPVGPKGPAAAPVAVIDFAGFDTTHPELPPSVTLRRAVPTPFDTSHATAVASVIAGRGPRVVGVNPGSDVRIYGSNGRCSDTAAAIRQAVRDGAEVISMSYGFAGRATCLSHEVATSYAASFAVLVAAGGNDRAQPWIQPGNDFHVLTVAALNALDQPTGFSHQGVHTDLAAPGEGIGVACPLYADRADGSPDGFCTWDGTSFSAPMVAAVAARVMAARPDLSPSQVSRLLSVSAADIGRPGWDIATGYGLVNLAAALAAPAPAHDPLEPNDDIEWLDGRHFRPDPPLLRRARRAVFSATLDALKDPVDVYPVWIGPRETLTATVRPAVGRMRLAIHHPQARTIFDNRGLVTPRLGIAPGRRGSVAVVNGGSRGRRVWVSIALPPGRQLFSGYQITLRRR